jgi:hypothetical protein
MPHTRQYLFTADAEHPCMGNEHSLEGAWLQPCHNSLHQESGLKLFQLTKTVNCDFPATKHGRRLTRRSGLQQIFLSSPLCLWKSSKPLSARGMFAEKSLHDYPLPLDILKR